MAKRATSYQRSNLWSDHAGRRQQRLHGLIVGVAGNQVDLIRGIDAVHGHPVTDRSFLLAELADAFPLQETGGRFGKNVLEF